MAFTGLCLRYWWVNTCVNEGLYDESNQHAELVAVVDHGCYPTADHHALFLEAQADADRSPQYLFMEEDHRGLAR